MWRVQRGLRALKNQVNRGQIIFIAFTLYNGRIILLIQTRGVRNPAWGEAWKIGGTGLGVWEDWVYDPSGLEVNPLKVILLEITRPPLPFIALTAEPGLIEPWKDEPRAGIARGCEAWLDGWEPGRGLNSEKHGKRLRDLRPCFQKVS